MKVTNHVEIEQDVQDAWEVLAAYGDADQWASGVELSLWDQPSDGSDPVGTSRLCAVPVFGTNLQERIERWEPGQRLTFVVTGMPAPVVRATSDWALRPLGRGRTELVTTVELQLKRGFGFMSPLMKRRFTRVVRSIAADFKTYVETGRPSPSKARELAHTAA